MFLIADDGFSKFVYESVDKDQSLFQASHLRAMCDLEDEVIHDYFRYQCRSHSVAMYVAALNKVKCHQINDTEVQQTLSLLQECHPFYTRGEILEHCDDSLCPYVPPQCYTFDAVYKIFYYLADIEFVREIESRVDNPMLRYGMLMLQDDQPFSKRESFYFDIVDGNKLENELVWISAMDLDMTFDLFIYYMINDMVYFLLAMVVIIIILAFYLKSCIMVTVTVLNVLFSITVAYFFYHVVFRFEFFPFVNLMVILLLIAICADDIFVMYDSWEDAKRDIPEKKNDSGNSLDGTAEKEMSNEDIKQDVEMNSMERNSKCSDEEKEAKSTEETTPVEDVDVEENIHADTEDYNFCECLNKKDEETAELEDYLEAWMRVTFKHGSASILVTSLSTASALFANYVSKVIVIRCFGIFAMTAVLCNLALMVTWIPAFLVINEKYQRAVKCCTKTNTTKFGAKIEKFTTLLVKYKNKVFEEYLPFIISKIWYVWIGLFSLIGIGGIVAMFIVPGLQLPSSVHFPLFPSDNTFEKYNSELKWEFEFENPDSSDSMGLVFLWGLDNEDNSNSLDPFDKGTLVLDENVNFFHETSQRYFINFCEKMKNQSFVRGDFRDIDCAYTLYWDILAGQCPVMNPLLNTQCCDTRIPANESLYEDCLPRLTLFAGLSGQSPWIGQHFYQQDINKVKVLIHTIKATQYWTADYNIMDDLYKELDDFTSEALEYSPTDLNEGWFHGGFSFYDLQSELARGTYTSLAISLSIAFFFILITTLNLLMSIYAIIGITLCICTTIGCLVLMGWELNIVESSIFTLAVGLSIDFTIHYGVAYVHSIRTTRKGKVDEAFERVGSAVAMAALTTFLAGACIMPTRIIAYRQLGTFLMLVMVFSYCFATFFFQAVLVIAGPIGDFLQLKCPPRCFSYLKCLQGDTLHVEEDDTIKDAEEEPVEGKSYVVLQPDTQANGNRKDAEDKPVEGKDYVVLQEETHANDGDNDVGDA